ncbi:ATP-binding cassette domain-containing protein [Cohaesibacter gelatinilyticus]|uniref:ABC-2 type transport system ATP-binding protein n=1 Tax=Cohaesibacter gelatinilyticus TaxID=372072 RepID=A0A285NE56_9HYPH|nr:ABC transporter ATP-binding protein [Cohaesibacter gelatinilyticus]SNZ07183.1 ABC-2 type transport system ATP-binding protein [Cohaesibacter gelatinilyticus]
MTGPLIQISALEKTFVRRPVLQSLDVDIASDDRIALIGSNGAGKTTLIRCLLGHYRHKGDILLAGEKVSTHNRSMLEAIAFVPQLPPPLKMPVADLIKFSCASGKADKDKIWDIADKLGLELAILMSIPFNRLSGGQKQKLLISIALARPAKLFIFDEPSANLDPAARSAFLDLLAQHKDRAMLIASHRLEEIASLVNRVIEMDQGKIVLDDRISDRLKEGDRRLCTLKLAVPSEALSKTLSEWDFSIASNGLSASGQVAGGDMIRFLSTLSRYGGLLSDISFENLGED